MKRSYQALQWVVEHGVGDAVCLDTKLRRGAEERLIAARRAALVVEDHCTGCDPARIELTGLGRYPCLRFAPGTVRVKKLQLQRRCRTFCEIADVGFATYSGRAN